jgi:hypothetical protein
MLIGLPLVCRAESPCRVLAQQGAQQPFACCALLQQTVGCCFVRHKLFKTLKPELLPPVVSET